MSADREGYLPLGGWISRDAVMCAVLLLLCAPSSPSAHDISRSASTLVIEGNEIRAALTLNIPDLRAMPDIDANHDGRVTYAELDDAIDRLYTAIRENFRVRSAETPVQTTVERYELLDDNTLRLDLVYRFNQVVTSVTVTSTLARITQPDHRHFVSVTREGTMHEAVLDLRTPTVGFAETVANPYWRTISSFVRLGIEHIFTGYDHLAFLLGLLVAVTTFGSVVKIVTSFTLAHSITLAVATFDAVVLPTRLTETLIAITIGYVAIENLLRVRPIERYRMTFLFGLVHGFGFSTVLRQMQLPRPDLALSLCSFNVGVELGQLAFVAAVFPCVLFLVSSRWHQRIRPAVSVCVACLAVYWFVERAFLN